MRADCRVEYAGKARLVERDEEVAGATLEVDEPRELLGRERAQRTSFEEDVDRRADEASRNVGRALRVLGRVARDRRCKACGDGAALEGRAANVGEECGRIEPEALTTRR